MSIDRKLLWKAWPDGYLAMRGIQTIEGWLFSSNCLVFSEEGIHKRNVSPRSSCVIHKPGTNNPEVQGWINAGDLLPNVDPADTATWACLLADLWEASTEEKPTGHLSWLRRRNKIGTTAACHLKQVSFTDRPINSTGITFGDLGTEDPALALVLARIQLRETS